MVRKKITKLSKDDTPMVRRSAAKCIPIISKHIEASFGKEFLLPMTQALLEDQNDSVKIYAVMSSLEVAKIVDDSKLLRDTIIPAF